MEGSAFALGWGEVVPGCAEGCGGLVVGEAGGGEEGEDAGLGRVGGGVDEAD